MGWEGKKSVPTPQSQWEHSIINSSQLYCVDQSPIVSVTALYQDITWHVMTWSYIWLGTLSVTMLCSQEATHLTRSQGSGKLTWQKRKLSCFYYLKSHKYHHNATTVETFKENKRKFSSNNHLLRDWNKPEKMRDHQRSSFIMLYVSRKMFYFYNQLSDILGEIITKCKYSDQLPPCQL